VTVNAGGRFWGQRVALLSVVVVVFAGVAGFGAGAVVVVA
jgi:hypothetical protein